MSNPVFLIPADATTWVQRVTAGVRAFENLLDTRLDSAHSGTKHRATRKEIPDLTKYLRSRLKPKSRWFSLFTGTGIQRIDGEFKNLDYYLFGGSMYADLPIFRATYMHPDVPMSKHEELLVHVGDALEAYSASYSPADTWTRHRLAHWCVVFSEGTAYIHELPDRTEAEARLPLIRDCSYAGLEHLLQPHHIGWINYWSAEVCDYLGFPGALENSSILKHSYRTPRGAWLVKLTEQPLEPLNDAHTEILREMYERLPRAGVRCSAEHVQVGRRPESVLPAGESS